MSATGEYLVRPFAPGDEESRVIAPASSSATRFLAWARRVRSTSQTARLRSSTTAAAASAPEGSAQQSEYEPNGILSNANPVAFAGAGTSVSGRVDAGSDSTDAFVFAPAIGGEYEIYLCAATCDDRLESDALTLSVLDHSQSTITGTPLDTVSEQSVAVTLDAGFAYYVEVSAYQTADNYRLVIVPAVD